MVTQPQLCNCYPAQRGKEKRHVDDLYMCQFMSGEKLRYFQTQRLYRTDPFLTDTFAPLVMHWLLAMLHLPNSTCTLPFGNNDCYHHQHTRHIIP